ncbi:MAG: hypothetical protein ACR2FE_12130 [Aeromicrobium sp.]
MSALVLAGLLLIGLASCGGSDGSRPKPASSAGKERAAAAFAEAYTTFRTDFAAATATGEEDGLQNASRAVRAVRSAYFDLAVATRAIDMPTVVTDDVDAMLGAIGDLIAALDKQAAATTSEDFQAANPESSSALEEADDAIRVVVDALGIGTDDPSAGGDGATKQPGLSPAYVSGATVSDAEAWVADLLEVGADNVNHEIPAEDMGAVVAWRAAFPEVLGETRVVGYERSAPENGISGFAVLPEDDTKTAGPTNSYFLAFAVRDDSGACAGGVLSGFPNPTEQRVVRLKAGTRCSGAAVASEAGY